MKLRTDAELSIVETGETASPTKKPGPYGVNSKASTPISSKTLPSASSSACSRTSRRRIRRRMRQLKKLGKLKSSKMNTASKCLKLQISADLLTSGASIQIVLSIHWKFQTLSVLALTTNCLRLKLVNMLLPIFLSIM